jgi:hypothetical protein
MEKQLATFRKKYLQKTGGHKIKPIYEGAGEDKNKRR